MFLLDSGASVLATHLKKHNIYRNHIQTISKLIKNLLLENFTLTYKNNREKELKLKYNLQHKNH